MKRIPEQVSTCGGSVISDTAEQKPGSPRDRMSRMASVLVKPQYRHVHGGCHFEGTLKSTPRLHHGAWICELYLEEDRDAVLFRLGHLDALVNAQPGVNLLNVAQGAGWNRQVATLPLEVALWTARDCASEMVHLAGHPGVEQGNMVMSTEAGDSEWKCLEDNLGRRPELQERVLFETEFARVLLDPSETNEWPEG
jgi:hypothetical protein